MLAMGLREVSSMDKMMRLGLRGMELDESLFEDLNYWAETNFEIARIMLCGVNLVLGTDFRWLKKRVVWSENPNTSVSEYYKCVHDAETVKPVLTVELSRLKCLQ